MKLKSFMLTSVLVLSVVQPALAQPGKPARARLQLHQSHSPNEGLELGNFFTNCDNPGSASVMTVNVPTSGQNHQVVRLTTTGVGAKGGYAETSIENLDTNPTYMYRPIDFETRGPMNQFLCEVGYIPPGSTTVLEKDFGLAGANVFQQDAILFPGTPPGHFIVPLDSPQVSGIPQGSRITGVAFDNHADNASGQTIVTDVFNVLLNKKFIPLDETDESSSCTNGGR